MKIQYINNTCDVDGLSGYGEIMILLKDGIPVSHIDGSDTVIEVDSLPTLLKPFGIDLEFESIEPTKKQVKIIKEYLKPIYGDGE